MKFTALCLTTLISVSAFAQSKKELAEQVTKLKLEIENLKKPKETELNNKYQKVGYGIGVLIASNIKRSGGDSLNVDAIQAGIKDVWLNQKLKIDPAQAEKEVGEYMQNAAEQKRLRVKPDGVAFLAANKNKEGVITTASGLQYKIIKTGTGKAPQLTDKVTVAYKGSTIDGMEFDSSEKQGGPAPYPANQYITGWSEALQLMHEGDKWMLYIPAELGYGERASGAIPPNSTLVFEIELLKVN